MLMQSKCVESSDVKLHRPKGNVPFNKTCNHFTAIEDNSGSVPSVCVFSTLGNTLSTKKGTKMFCEMVDKMIILNKNGQGLF